MTEPVLVTKPTGPGSSRVIKFAAIGAGLILVVMFVPKLLGGGGGGGNTTALSPTPGGVASTTTTTVAGSGGVDTQTLGSFGGRDPFDPLPAELVADSSSSSTDTPSSSITQPVITGDVVSDVGGLVSGGSGSTTTTTAPPRPVHRLSLLEVYSRPDGSPGARVRVDDNVMETAVGQDFGTNYRTVSLDPGAGCGVFLFGDARISLCERQETQT